MGLARHNRVIFILTRQKAPNLWVFLLQSKLRMIIFIMQDTAGQERFHALGPIYYRDADGMYLANSIFSIIDEFTLENYEHFILFFW